MRTPDPRLPTRPGRAARRALLGVALALLAPAPAAEDPVATDPVATRGVVARPAGAAPAAARGALADPASVAAAAARIDRLVEDRLTRQGLTPAPAVDDTAFVRRAYLDIAGRIPTADEAAAFLDDRAVDKRTRLVDTLLDGPGYDARMFLWYADLFRLRTKLARRTSGEPFAHWLKQAVADDVPYDRLVHELLTATGPAHEEGSGATGYLLRDRGMPEDSMSNTARVFLGMRIECAQCHDHPFNDWSQRQYFELVAFTGGMDYEIDLGATERGPRLLELRAEARQLLGKPGAKAFDRMLRPVRTGIEGSGTATVALPDDYRSEAGGAPGAWVEARTLSGEAVGPEPEFAQAPPRRGSPRRNGDRPRGRPKAPEPLPVGSRLAFADWVVSPGNPTFTTVIANRMWQRVMGHGLVEPVDDLQAAEPVAPELLAELETLMVELGYDLRAFQRVLFHTDAWQRQAPATDLAWDDPAALGAPPLRRMDANQVWDSLLTLVLEDVDGQLAPPRDAYAARIYASFEELSRLPDDELLEEVRFRSLRYSDPDAYRAEQRDRKQERKAERREEQRDRKADKQADKQALKPLRNALKKAERRGDDEAAEAARAELAAAEAEREDRRGAADDDSETMPPGPARSKRPSKGLVRAADLPAPAPAGHLLREFGQSDREQIDAAHTDPNVPQVLALLNGFLEEHLLTNPDAVLGQRIEAAASVDTRIETAFLALLARRPSAAELSLWRGEVGRVGRDAYSDLVWTLANTHEFLFVR